MARARDLVYQEFNLSLPNFIESQGGSSEQGVQVCNTLSPSRIGHAFFWNTFEELENLAINIKFRVQDRFQTVSYELRVQQ
jgi:hypothetical protein